MSLSLATRRHVALDLFRWTAGRQAVAEVAHFRRDLIAQKTGTDRDGRRAALAFCWAADWAEELAEELAGLDEIGLRQAGLDVAREATRRIRDGRLLACREFGVNPSLAVSGPLVIEMMDSWLGDEGAALAGRN